MIEGIGKYSSGTKSYNGKAVSMQTNQLNFQSRLMDEDIDFGQSLNRKKALAFQQQDQNVGEAITQNKEAVLRMLNLMGVKRKSGINWESDGSDKLTDEQVRDLSGRYDVEDLSREEYYSLLTELVNLNVISGDDFEKQFIKQASPETAEYGYMLTAAFPNSYEAEYGDYLEKFLKDADMFEYYSRMIEEGKTSVHASNIYRMKEYYKDEKERCERLAEVLGQIRREDRDSRITKPKRSFDGLDVLGPSAPDEVKEAWKQAEEESGVNGYGMNSEGKFTQITALFAMSIEKMVNGSGQDILGNTISSATEAVRKALGRLGIPKSDEEKKEQLFYEVFLRLLG